MFSGRRNRSEHYSPQGFLRGFIAPGREDYPRPLWVFDIAARQWSEKSPRQVGEGRGFYTYADGVRMTGSAEEEFLSLENQLPAAREMIRRDGFESWRKHREVLAGFAAMLSARSPNFLRQMAAAIKAASPDLSNQAVRNRALDAMRREIRTRTSAFLNFDWCLRYATSFQRPFVASDQCVYFSGTKPTIQDGVRDPLTLLIVPLAWDMALFGSATPFRDPTAPSPFEQVDSIRRELFATAERWVASPILIDVEG